VTDDADKPELGYDPETHVLITYELLVHRAAYKDCSFTDEQKRKLRPIAEVLALLDGNAFFSMELGNGKQWYEQYLPEANELYTGTGGWADQVSWIRDLEHENDAVREAYESYRILKALSQAD